MRVARPDCDPYRVQSVVHLFYRSVVTELSRLYGTFYGVVAAVVELAAYQMGDELVLGHLLLDRSLQRGFEGVVHAE